MIIQEQVIAVILTTCRGYLRFWKIKDTKRIEGLVVV